MAPSQYSCRPAQRGDYAVRDWIDGSNYGYAPVESSDMVFVPDLDSATVDPFAEVPTLTMIGDVMIIDRPGQPAL